MRQLPIILAFLLITSLPPHVNADLRARVDLRVLQDTNNGNVARFIVMLHTQAQPHVPANASRIARGQIVFDALQRTAATAQAGIRAQLDALQVKYRAYTVVNALVVEGNRDLVNALAMRADVLAIEADREFRVPLEQSTNPRTPATPNAIDWNINKINAPALWINGFTGQGIVYANADTGVQWDHPALKPHYRGWDGVSANHNYNWWDGVRAPIVGGNPCGYATNAPCDDSGHGTHTMGIGIGDDGAGNQIGVAPGAKWIACRNMDHGVGRPSTYIECYNFFLAPTDLNGNNPDPSKRPDVVGNSYTCPPSELCATDSLQMAMDNLRAAGIFMAVSASNYGSTCSSILEPPALYDSAITIGATDENDTIAAFSSRGPVTIDGSNRRKPDLVAPGVSVNSSYPGNTYAELSGTSMASPHVAGAVALLWSAFPALRNNVDFTETLLERTAIPLMTTQTCGDDVAYQSPNNVYGYGRIDVLAAYNHFLQTGLPPYAYWFPLVTTNR